MSDSWETFLQLIREECHAFRALNGAAVNLSQAIVENVADTITAAQEATEAARKTYVATLSKRRGMQQRGFKGMPLRQCCVYAPPHLMGELTQRVQELTYYAISLEIVNNNNRTLILGGMERLVNIMSAVQRAREPMLTYKRRGVPAPVRNSVLMSEKV